MARCYLVQMRRQPSEFQQFVFLQSFGQANIVEVIEAVNRITECFVIFLFDEEIIVGIIDSLQIELNQRINIQQRMRMVGIRLHVGRR